MVSNLGLIKAAGKLLERCCKPAAVACISRSLSTEASFKVPEDAAIKKGDHFEIVTENGQKILATFSWLRDHCRSPAMYNLNSHQRIFDVRTVREAAVPAFHSCNEDGLHITWRDGHTSNFSWKFLTETCRNTRRHRLVEDSSHMKPKPWDAKSVPSLEEITIPYNRLMASIDFLKLAYINLMKHGILLVDGVPTDNEEGMLKIVNRIAKPINLGINYGQSGLWVLSTDEEDVSDLGHSNSALQPHTDGTFLISAPGLLAFHCLKAADEGGDTSLIDGFKVAEDLRLKNPEAYQYLSRIPVEAQYLHTRTEPHEHFYNVDCLIKHHPDKPDQIAQVRFNDWDRAPLSMSLEGQREFYKHYLEFVQGILDEKNCFWYSQTPGTVVIVNNWRVLHGRSEYRGERIMTGYYISQDDVLSRMATLGL